MIDENGKVLAGHGRLVFGFFGGPTVDRIYYDLIGSARCPISILTGDAELFPMRSPQRSGAVSTASIDISSGNYSPTRQLSIARRMRIICF